MMKRLLTATLCLCMLLSLLTIGVSATSLTLPVGATPAESGEYAALPFTVSYGNYDGKTVSELTALSDAEAATIAAGASDGFTVSSTTGLPCQVYTVDVSAVQEESILLTLDASTIENEQFALKVLNPATNEWDTVDAATTALSIGGRVDLATYAKDGKIQAMAMPNYVTNGSNRMLWSTDPQHYTEFVDLNQTYYDIHNYMAEEYTAGNVAYVITTGDIVDDPPSYSTSAKQWQVADKAFAILDEAGVPYGIVTGNHDVGDYPINNYTNFVKHFPEERYADTPWYGGTVNDNKCHYDLVTVGNVDLLMMYIGYGLEDDQEVLNWANSVLDMYPHRSAIICTHQYLDPISLQRKGRGEILYNTLVTAHDNVAMVLSGHYEGAGYRMDEVDGRILPQVISDYQFVQAEDDEYYADAPDPTHSIGDVPHCNGEGYIREVIIEGNTVSMYAFSPVTGGETPYGLRDDITLTVPFATPQREITVKRFGAFTSDGTPNTEIYSWTYDDTGAVEYVVIPMAAGDMLEPIAAVSNDRAQLQTLIDACKAVKKSGYTADSYQAMKEALTTAKAALKSGSDEEVADAYHALDVAKGALTEKVESLSRDSLELVHEFDLDLSAWQNGDGTKKLTTAHSYIKAEQLEDGGFTVEKSSIASNNWPSLQYIEPITFTPKNGKVYLYLDLEAGSTWSCYPVVIQDMQQYNGRWNYIIEGSYQSSFDAGGGPYVGVFDVTEALEDLGVDMSKEMTISFSMNIVPGPVTVREIALLTGGSSDFPWLWVLLGVVVLLAIGAVLFAVLYTPKKTTSTPAADATVESETTADTVVNDATPEEATPEDAAPASEAEETPPADAD